MTQFRIEKLVEKGRGIVVLQISGYEEPFLVSDEIAFRHKLKSGIVITQSQVDALLSASELFRSDQEVARLLALRDHTSGEVRLKLKRKGFGAESIKEVMKKYVDSGILDDTRVARKLAERMIEQRPCGRSFLIAYLRKKQIDQTLASEVVAELFSRGSEIEQARLALERRWNRFKDFQLEAARTKAYTYLARRGFSYDAARVVFSEMWKKQPPKHE